MLAYIAATQGMTSIPVFTVQWTCVAGPVGKNAVDRCQQC